MIRSLFSATTGMNAQDLNVSVIPNILANVNTLGFKKFRPEFQDLWSGYHYPHGRNNHWIGLCSGHGRKY